MDGTITIETNIDTKMFDRQIKYIEEKMLDIEYQLEQADKGFEVGDTLKLEAEYEKLGNQLTNLIQKRDELNNAGTINIKEHIDRIGNSIGDVIKKVGKWALAVFSVRSAYMFVRQSMSTLASTDDGMATKLEYIRWALANTIKPIIEWIINAVYKILSIFGGIIKGISGYNIFAKSTVKSFEKMKKSSGAIKKNTNAIKKTLYGWDELTRVEESGGIASGGGGIGSGLQDLKDLLPQLDKEVDSMAEKIKKFFIGDYDTLGEALKNAPKDILSFYESMFKGIYGKILEPYLVKPTLKAFKETYGPAYDYAMKYFINPLKAEFEPVVQSLKDKFTPIADWLNENVLEKFKSKFNNFKNELLNILAPFINGVIDWINQTFGIFGVHIEHVKTKTDNTKKNINGAIKGVKDTMNTELGKVDKKVDGTGKNIDTDINDNLIDAKKYADDLSKGTYNVDVENGQINTAKTGLSDLLDKLKTLTSKTWKVVTSVTTSGKTLKNWYNDTLREKLKSVGIDIPKLAKGGVINQPGRGVPIAYGGERGQEGVIPLTDSQQMALLGEAIGRYITINASITNTMNGRIISRELQKIQNENNFANNR